MHCPGCQTEYVEEDLFCRHCGAELDVPSTSIVLARPNLPAVLQNAQLPRRVAAGVGAVALGFGIELLRRSLIARLQAPRSLPAPVIPGLKEILQPQSSKMVKLPRGYEVHETVVYMQRVIRREN